LRIVADAMADSLSDESAWFIFVSMLRRLFARVYVMA
jgi:hypothetical protein